MEASDGTLSGMKYLTVLITLGAGWPKVPFALQCTELLTFGLNNMTIGLQKKVGAVFRLVVN